MVKPTMDTFLTSNNMEEESASSKPKRKRVHIPHSQRSPEFVAQRNERERSRVHSVNEAFMVLKQHVPLKVRDPSKRVSKAKILQAAIDHIYNLLDTLENRATQEDFSTTQRCSQNNRPVKKSRSQTKKCQARKQTSAATEDVTRNQSYFECIPEVKENQYHKRTDERLFSDNSQYQPQMESTHYGQYSPKTYNQFHSEFQRTHQQQYITPPYSTYGHCQTAPQLDNLQRYPTIEHDFRGDSAHSPVDSWMAVNPTIPQQNITEYHQNLVQTSGQENGTTNQIPQSWLHDLPSPNDSGFADDKSTSGVSEVSSPMSDDDLSENTSYTPVWNQDFVGHYSA